MHEPGFVIHLYSNFNNIQKYTITIKWLYLINRVVCQLLFCIFEPQKSLICFLLVTNLPFKTLVKLSDFQQTEKCDKTA